MHRFSQENHQDYLVNKVSLGYAVEFCITLLVFDEHDSTLQTKLLS